MFVELDDEHTKCSICNTEFSCDRDSQDPDSRQHLPVLSSSQRCDHWFCHGCILREQQRVAQEENIDGKVPKWIKCMHCREKTSFNPAEPMYHRLLIDLLARAQNAACSTEYLETSSVQQRSETIMIVELGDEHKKCSICTTNFSSDTDNKVSEIRQHLPVLSSSQRCDHWFCHGCILREQLRVAEGNSKGRVPKWIKCMHCREKTSFNPAEPKYHRLLIDLLARAQNYEEEKKIQRRLKEKELNKKLNEEVNNFLSAWVLLPEKLYLNPIAAATPTRDEKDWMAKHLRVGRARIDRWFYRKRMKLKSQHQHMPETARQAPKNNPQPSIFYFSQIKGEPKEEFFQFLLDYQDALIINDVHKMKQMKNQRDAKSQRLRSKRFRNERRDEKRSQQRQLTRLNKAWQQCNLEQKMQQQQRQQHNVIDGDHVIESAQCIRQQQQQEQPKTQQHDATLC